MSYRQNLHNQLTNLGIYSKAKSDTSIKIPKGYYLTHELISLVSTGKEPTTFKRRTSEFAEMLDTNVQTIRNRTIAGKVTVLQEGYYDKEKFLNFLLERNV